MAHEAPNLGVRFETRAVRNKARSDGEKILDTENNVVHEIKASGRDEFDNVIYVKIEIPGDRFNECNRPAKFCLGAEKMDDPVAWKSKCRAPADPRGRPRVEECDVHRFPDEWAAFTAGKAEQIHGTPLRDWAQIDRASVEELAFYRVHTVEQLATLNDSNASKFFHLRQQARDFLEEKSKAVNSRAALKAKDDQIAAMQERLAALEAALPKGPKKQEKAA